MNPEIYILTEDEAVAGFHKYLVGDPFPDNDEGDDKRLVVGHIVSTSDMLWKVSHFGSIRYKLQRFGLSKNRKPTDLPRWYPIGIRVFEDAGNAVQESNFGEPESGIDNVIPSPFVCEETNE